MAKRAGNYRVVIYPDEIAAILRIHLRTAQKLVRDIRKELKMRKGMPVSIRKFCHFYVYEEDEIRTALKVMYGEDDE
jgi:hypothetical protein